jgi:hypothetical protein
MAAKSCGPVTGTLPLKSKERLLWARLSSQRLGLHFRRQQTIWRYIADFYSASARLIIDLMRTRALSPISSYMMRPVRTGSRRAAIA